MPIVAGVVMEGYLARAIGDRARGSSGVLMNELFFVARELGVGNGVLGGAMPDAAAKTSPTHPLPLTHTRSLRFSLSDGNTCNQASAPVVTPYVQPAVNPFSSGQCELNTNSFRFHATGRDCYPNPSSGPDPMHWCVWRTD